MHVIIAPPQLLGLDRHTDDGQDFELVHRQLRHVLAEIFK